MATRMQQRRGTAAQWISTNSGNGPILAAGEIGYESDTNKFKIGDGTNHWLTLDYFMDADSTVNPQFGSSIKFEGATANEFETTLAVTDPTADRTITLPNATGTVALMSDITDLIGTAGAALNTLGELSDALDDDASYAATITAALATKLSKADGGTMQAAIAMGSNKITGLSDPGAAQDAATKAYVDNTVVSYLPLTGGTMVGGITFEGSTADGFETTISAVDPTADRVIEFPNAGGIIVLKDSTDILTNKTLTSPTISGLALSDSSIVIEGSSVNEFDTTLIVTNPTANRTITFQDATGTVAFAGDIETHRSDTTDVHGLSDTSDIVLKSGAQTLGGAKTFTGDVTLPVNTSIGIVTSTEIGYLDNVTSAIQTQLDAKAPLASPTFTGTVTLPSGTVTSAMILDGTILVGDLADGAVTSAKILDGTIVDADINANAAIDWTKLGISSTVSSTEIGYVDGVTSAIQTQLDAKAALASPTFTGTVNAAALTLSGDLTVNGTTTTINSTTMSVDDKNIVLGDVATPSDVTADGGGITLKGATDKTFNWVDATDSWTSSENINLASGKDLKVNGTSVLSTTAGGFIFTDGTQTKEGVPSRTSIIQKTAEYTLSAANERDSLIEISHTGGTAIKLLIPTDATFNFPIGTSIDVLRTNTGAVTIEAVTPGTTTVNSTPGLKLRAQWSSATLFKRAANLWVVMGDLSA